MGMETDLTDEQAMDAIHEILDGKEWSVSDLDSIASIVQATGRRVRDPAEADRS